MLRQYKAVCSNSVDSLPLAICAIATFFVILFACTPTVYAQAKIQTLNLCIDPDWMPFEGFVDNKYTGISRDYANLFAQNSDYSFNVVSSGSWQETLESLKSGKCDLTLLINSTPEREKYLSFTLPYFFGPNVLVSKSGIPFMQDVNALGNKTLGIVSGYRLLEEIPKFYPNANIKVVNSEEEGLRLVDDGSLDVFVGSLYSISLSLERLSLSDLRINGWISIQDKLRIGLTKKNEHLVPTFNQAIDAITSEEHNRILNRWSNVQYVKQTDYSLLYWIISSCLIIFTVFLWRHMLSLKVVSALSAKNLELDRTRQELIKANEHLEFLSFHDNLTNLYNRRYFLSALNSHLAQKQRQHSESSLLMIDLDHFKKINDTHGHSAGDKVLKTFGSITLSVLRAGDVAARWGGEEFIILLPESDKTDSLSFANRLVEAVKQGICELDVPVTISIGVGQLHHNDSVESWIERADEALYHAKREGRNRIETRE